MAQILNQADAPAWYDFVLNFDDTYNRFYDNYNALMYLGPYVQSNHPELLPLYNDMLQRGSESAYKLEELKATRDYVYSWLQWLQSGVGNITNFVSSGAQSIYDAAKAALGLSGLQGFNCNPNPNNRPLQLSGLGVVPVAVAIVGIAAATVALVAIGKWITDAYVFAQRLNALQEQEAKGASPQQAAQIVNATMGPPSSSEFLGIPWNMLIFAAIAVFVGPPLINAIADNNQRYARRR